MRILPKYIHILRKWVNLILLTVNSSDSIRSLEITFWCSEARPNSSSNPIFAVGTSEGLQTIHVGNFSSDSKSVLNRPKDVLAVEWLSPTVIASGFRDSLLFLSDLRSNDSVQRIKHPGMIGQIKKIDDHQFVVAGTRSVSLFVSPNSADSSTNVVAWKKSFKRTIYASQKMK